MLCMLCNSLTPPETPGGKNETPFSCAGSIEGRRPKENYKESEECLMVCLGIYLSLPHLIPSAVTSYHVVSYDPTHPLDHHRYPLQFSLLQRHLVMRVRFLGSRASALRSVSLAVDVVERKLRLGGNVPDGKEG